jgi:hypothetical protein
MYEVNISKIASAKMAVEKMKASVIKAIALDATKP